MKMEIIGKKYIVSDKLEGVITRKLGKFDRYFDDSTEATVVCKEANRGVYTMEVTIRLADNYIIRSEVDSKNMYANIDIVLPKIEGQVRKYKTKLANKLNANAYKDDSIYYNEGEVVEEAAPAETIVKEKSFVLNKISLEEAIAQLDLVGNDFYAFYHAERERINIVYRRKDGELGLIDLQY